MLEFSQSPYTTFIEECSNGFSSLDKNVLILLNFEHRPIEHKLCQADMIMG